MLAGQLLRRLGTAWRRWPSWKTVRTWWILFCLGIAALACAFITLRLWHWWPDSLMPLQWAHVIKKGNGSATLGNKHQVFCLLPAGTSPDEIAAYLTPEMKSDLDFWVGLTARPASGEWWLAIQREQGDRSLHRMSGQFRPDITEPLCANGQRLTVYGLASSPSARYPTGQTFQVRVLAP